MKFQAILYPVVLALSYGAGSVVAATLPVRQDPTPVGAVDSVVTWGADVRSIVAALERLKW
ncbi:hypothetical protein BJ166DRAFT_626822 [Pestalotiopsis sp. NC0098]|nr:hypothetical protein BJ166DRAFT_626822 [Pestalotiopsis sp. NC0098]